MILPKLLNCLLFLATLQHNINEIVSSGGGASPAENEIVILPMEEGDKRKPSDKGDKFSLSGDPRTQKNILEFRLSNRLAVAVCDTYDNYLASGKPYTGQINYNVTVQTIRSPVPPDTCQSFKIKRCYNLPEGTTAADCGWTKSPTC